MNKVNVLVVSRLGLHEGFLRDIAAVDTRVNANDATAQLVAELRRKGRKGHLIDMMERESASADSLPGATQTEQDLDSRLAEAEVIFAMVVIPDDLLSRAPRLRWIHFGGAGMDKYISTGILQSRVIVTNSRGVAAVPIAEHILAFMFMLARNAPLLVANKQNKIWEKFHVIELRDKVVGLVGLGAIGGELARLAAAIGMKVIGTRRSATRRESNVARVEEVFPPSELRHMLSESDFVVIAAPLTPETRGLIGEAEMQAMKPSAYLINVARGPIVDQRALIRALKTGQLAGAGLDVFETEPLPQDSELWDLPNVVLSPHMAQNTDRRSHRIVDMFCRNLRRYLAGEPMLNMIGTDKGY
ncbi:MAG: D-2-hydroxyacid dehydrogenase [Chloroflexi bacterium]|nr:D-2-hydroxyacid dehydrogenase [Chloroflexota bacterium]